MDTAHMQWASGTLATVIGIIPRQGEVLTHSLGFTPMERITMTGYPVIAVRTSLGMI